MLDFNRVHFRANLRQIVDNHVFIIDQLTGVLQTNETYARFADGYFEISVKAMNAPDKNDLMKIKVKFRFNLRINSNGC